MLENTASLKRSATIERLICFFFSAVIWSTKSIYSKYFSLDILSPLDSIILFLVLEFSNHTSNSIRLYANSGAAQILFFCGDQPEVSYSDRKGKYQGQVGITLAKSK